MLQPWRSWVTAVEERCWKGYQNLQQDSDIESSHKPRWRAVSFDDSTLKNGWRTIILHKGKTILLLITTLVLFILLIKSPGASFQLLTSTYLPPANLHLIVPASNADPNLCKVLVSAGVLGYPAPAIVNWQRQFFDEELLAGGSHLAKIEGVNDYLLKLDQSKDDDLVLMIDGYDVWMQLRPQTLIERFWAINRRADERVTSRMNGTAAELGMQQEIVFGAEKRCWPWEWDQPPCYAVPESTLPGDVYGSITDTDANWDYDPWAAYRPRYLNSGVVLGTVRAMRKLFGEAAHILEYDRNTGSDQLIFSQIFGEQQVLREAVRREQFPDRDLQEYDPYNPEHFDRAREFAASRPDGSYEFHIGLDFKSELGLATGHADDEMAWLTWSAPGGRLAAEAQPHPVFEAPKHQENATLPLDIATTKKPFCTSSNTDRNNNPHLPSCKMAWEDVPLFTNLWSGVVPAIIHQNSDREYDKPSRQRWWDRIWFQRAARDLYDAWAEDKSKTAPIARAGGRDYYPAEQSRGGLRVDDGSWLAYGDVCAPFYDEIWRDGRGPWVASGAS